MEDRGAWEREMVRVFLAEHDALCPGCGYNLRGTPGDRCPECARPLVLGIRNDDSQSRWEMVGMVGVVVCSIYFGFMLVLRARWLFDAAFTSSSMGGVRSLLWMQLVSQVILSVGSIGWCIAMFATRTPTLSAVGLCTTS